MLALALWSGAFVLSLGVQRSAARNPRPLPRAAGKLIHISGESLGGEFEPFDHGEVWEKLIRKVMDGHLRSNGQSRCLNEFPGL
jgi:hypothetical protein